MHIPWRLLWIVLPVILLVYILTPWRVSVYAEPLVFPVVSGVEKTYQVEAEIKVNKPGFVTLTLLEGTGTRVEMAREVIFALKSRKVTIPFVTSEQSSLSLEAKFFRSATVVEAARGVSLEGVYLLAGYNKGQVILYQKPPNYPTFKVLGTASTQEGYLSLNLLQGLGFSPKQEGTQISWLMDPNIEVRVTSSPCLITLASTKYPDLTFSVPLDGTLQVAENGLIKGEGVVLPLPKNVASSLQATTYPQLSLVFGRGYFTVQDVPTTAFSYIDRFATYMLDLATFNKDNRAREVYQHLNSLKLSIEDGSSRFAEVWLKDRDETETFLEQFVSHGSSCSLQSPIPNPVIASGFGERTHPLLKTKVFHSGIDILAIPGYPLRAPADATVIYRGYKPQWGYFVVLDHGGCTTVFAHLLRLPQGGSYKKGEVFAYSGASGFVTGPHLHFEVRIEGKPVDPRVYIGVK